LFAEDFTVWSPLFITATYTQSYILSHQQKGMPKLASLFIPNILIDISSKKR